MRKDPFQNDTAPPIFYTDGIYKHISDPTMRHILADSGLWCFYGKSLAGCFFCSRSSGGAKQDINKQKTSGPIVMKTAVICLFNGGENNFKVRRLHKNFLARFRGRGNIPWAHNIYRSLSRREQHKHGWNLLTARKLLTLLGKIHYVEYFGTGTKYAKPSKAVNKPLITT